MLKKWNWFLRMRNVALERDQWWFFCHGNKHSAFKRAENFMSNLYLPYYTSCVGFSRRMLRIVIGHCILKLLWLIAGIQTYRLRRASNSLLIFTGWRVVLSQTQIITSYFLFRSQTTNLEILLVQVQRCLLISKGIPLSTCQPARFLFLNTCFELCLKFLQGCLVRIILFHILTHSL